MTPFDIIAATDGATKAYTIVDESGTDRPSNTLQTVPEKKKLRLPFAFYGVIAWTRKEKVKKQTKIQIKDLHNLFQDGGPLGWGPPDFAEDGAIVVWLRRLKVWIETHKRHLTLLNPEKKRLAIACLSDASTVLKNLKRRLLNQSVEIFQLIVQINHIFPICIVFIWQPRNCGDFVKKPHMLAKKAKKVGHSMISNQGHTVEYRFQKTMLKIVANENKPPLSLKRKDLKPLFKIFRMSDFKAVRQQLALRIRLDNLPGCCSFRNASCRHCGASNPNSQHVLFQCPKHIEIRKEILGKETIDSDTFSTYMGPLLKLTTQLAAALYSESHPLRKPEDEDPESNEKEEEIDDTLIREMREQKGLSNISIQEWKERVENGREEEDEDDRWDLGDEEEEEEDEDEEDEDDPWNEEDEEEELIFG